MGVKYKTRNGCIVEVVDVSKMKGRIRIIKSIKNYYQIGIQLTLLAPDLNPLNWRGGAHGIEYDIIEKINSEDKSYDEEWM